MDRHTCHRLRQWLRAEHLDRTLGYLRYPNEALHDALGLVRLKGRRHHFPCAKA